MTFITNAIGLFMCLINLQVIINIFYELNLEFKIGSF